MFAKFFLPLALATTFTTTSLSHSIAQSRVLMDSSPQQPLIFALNDGQWDEQVRFRAANGDIIMWFMDDGIYHQFTREVSDDSEPGRRFKGPSSNLEYLMVRAILEGANKNAEVVGELPLGYRCNYFLGSDPSRWRVNVPNYESIVYHDIYSGIDLRYYYNGAAMEYDFIVSAGADPSQIRLRYDGANDITISEAGELEITIDWGTITQTAPIVYQRVGSKQCALEGGYELFDNNSIGFVVRDDQSPDMALVIDPVILYSSYLGGSYTQVATSNALDSYGNVVVAGDTRSLNFPLLDPYQSASAGSKDIFLTKINPTTGQILYSTYFGGTGSDADPTIVLDAQDNICAVFYTNSTDLPTVTPYQSKLRGNYDAFVLKLSAAGNQLLAATYLGGTDADYPWDIAVDLQGNMYVCGETSSSKSFPLYNAVNPAYAGGVADGFVTKLNASGSALIFSTFLGGGGISGMTTADDVLYAIVVNEVGEVYVGGATYCLDYPAVNALYGPQINPEGPVDAVITKFSAAGNTLLFSTFLGGTEDECVQDMALDASENLVLAGWVQSGDFPTLNAYQTERCGNDSMDACFITTMRGDGSELLQSTYFGGCDRDYLEAVAIGPDGDIYITGWTFSPDFPTVDPLFDQLMGAPDAFVAVFDPLVSAVRYSTYFGGSHGEYAQDIAVDDKGWVHVAGYTMSTDIPLVNPTQSTTTEYPAGYDAFLLWIKGGCCVGTAGNFDGDPLDRLDILDVIYSLDWYFAYGDRPDCRAEGDVDGNGKIDIEDLVYLVNYVFRSGPGPAECMD